MRRFSLGLTAALLSCIAANVRSEPAIPSNSNRSSKPDFGRDIMPILAARCSSCHGDSQQKGGLRLDRKTEAMKGGNSGAAIVPGRSGDSLLVKRISGRAGTIMPPSGERLNATQIQLLK